MLQNRNFWLIPECEGPNMNYLIISIHCWSMEHHCFTLCSILVVVALRQSFEGMVKSYNSEPKTAPLFSSHIVDYSLHSVVPPLPSSSNAGSCYTVISYSLKGVQRGWGPGRVLSVFHICECPPFRSGALRSCPARPRSAFGDVHSPPRRRLASGQS